jgi:transcriptional regulator with XRE-family HTH domain
MQTLESQLRFVLLRQIDRGQQSVSLLARRSGLSQPSVSNFLHAKRNASMESFSWLLEAAGFEAQIFPKEVAMDRPAIRPKAIAELHRTMKEQRMPEVEENARSQRQREAEAEHQRR